MSKTSLSFLSEEEIGAIHNASLHVLENTGIKVKSKKALNILNEAGASVDWISFILGEKHTLKHYKELGGPKLSDRSIFEAWQKKGSKPIDEVAKEKVKEILATHKIKPIPEDVEREISRILARAEAELLPKSRS